MELSSSIARPIKVPGLHSVIVLQQSTTTTFLQTVDQQDYLHAIYGQDPLLSFTRTIPYRRSTEQWSS